MMNFYQMLGLQVDCGPDDLTSTFSKVSEAYDFVNKYSEHRESSNIANSKLERLRKGGEAFNLSNNMENYKFDESFETQISRIREEMDYSRTYEEILNKGIIGKVDELPGCGEKYYFMACIELAKDNSVEGFKQAANYLKLALNYRPDSTAYKGLLEVMNEKFERLELQRVEEFESAEKVRLEEERTSKRSLRKNRR